MRLTWFGMLAALLMACPLAAQAPTTPPAQALDPTGARLDALLLRWEQEMKAIQTAQAQCSRTEVDKVKGNTKVYDGMLRFMRPNLFSLNMARRGKADIWEKYIFTGTYLYEFVPDKKEIRVHDLGGERRPSQAADNQMSFILGMKASEAKQRYDLRFVKEDQWYYYVEILPKAAADKADFQRSRLVLTKDKFLPRQLWFEEPNGNEVTWEIPRVEANALLKRDEFSQPQTPAGWNLVRDPKPTGATAPGADVKPRIVRPQQ